MKFVDTGKQSWAAIKAMI